MKEKILHTATVSTETSPESDKKSNKTLKKRIPRIESGNIQKCSQVIYKQPEKIYMDKLDKAVSNIRKLDKIIINPHKHFPKWCLKLCTGCVMCEGMKGL